MNVLTKNHWVLGLAMIALGLSACSGADDPAARSQPDERLGAAVTSVDTTGGLPTPSGSTSNPTAGEVAAPGIVLPQPTCACDPRALAADVLAALNAQKSAVVTQITSVENQLEGALYSGDSATAATLQAQLTVLQSEVASLDSLLTTVVPLASHC